MFSNETIHKLREIHMGVMAEQLSAQLEDPQFRNVPFEDRLAMLVDAEWSARKSNRLTGLIKKAGYADTQASVENIEYIAERHLDREQILRLASCSYIQEARNVIILGATGAGKTFLACSLGVAANRNFYAARYLRLPDLLVEIAVARRDGTYREYMKQLKKVKLLILDEWLLYPLKEAEARDVLELVEARNKVASTIFCSQYDTSEWHENLYDPTLADAICDRIIYNAYTVQIEGESMRKRMGMTEKFPRRPGAPFGRCPWTDVVVHAPRPRCRTSGKGVRFQRSGCRTANGQGVVFGRHIHLWPENWGEYLRQVNFIEKFACFCSLAKVNASL